MDRGWWECNPRFQQPLRGPWAEQQPGTWGILGQMARVYCSLFGDSPAVANNVKSKG